MTNFDKAGLQNVGNNMTDFACNTLRKTLKLTNENTKREADVALHGGKLFEKGVMKHAYMFHAEVSPHVKNI